MRTTRSVIFTGMPADFDNVMDGSLMTSLNLVRAILGSVITEPPVLGARATRYRLNV